MSNIISIELDPIKDGLKDKTKHIESTAGRYVILGTNYQHRVISEKEFWEYMQKMDEADNAAQMIIDDYLIFFDKSKIFQVAGEDYFVGSFIVVSPCESGSNVFKRFNEEQIDEIKADLSGYFTELIVDGERCEALGID